jgi:short-subunit dehydrogenase
MHFQNKVVVLTGASTGIGYSLAKLLPRENCSLALLARRKYLLDELVEKHSLNKNLTKTFQCDVAVRENVKSAFDEIKKYFGRIDIAILNAGTSYRASIENYSALGAKETFEVNALGIVNCVEQLLADFMKRKEGMIVGVSSLSDARGFPQSGFYSASKSAATFLLESLRIELKPYKIKVITVKPGFVKTPMTDKNEFYMPLLMDVDKAAGIILNGIKKEKRIIQFPFPTAFGSRLLRIMPDLLFEWLAGFKLPQRKNQ